MFMKHLLAIDNDVVERKSLNYAIYVMKDVLQLPEAIIAYVISVNYDNALYNALLFFCYTDTCCTDNYCYQTMENPQTEYGIIKQGLFTSVGAYRYYFEHYNVEDYNYEKEFSAYIKIYDTISNYVLNFAYYEGGEIKIRQYGEKQFAKYEC